jgi:hypothetical protein
MATLKKGDKGDAVKKLQQLLKINPSDGIFGPNTEIKVREYQKANGLTADGVVGDVTATKLGFNIEEYLSTDLSTSNATASPIITPPSPGNSYKTPLGLEIYKKMLDSDEYTPSHFSKYWLLLHHTAGGHNPYATIDQWNNDTRGRIATQFVIGGLSTSNSDSKYDGVVVECFPEGSWASHIGANGNSHLHPESVGIEVCNYGYLTKQADGSFVNYVGGKVPNNAVVDLGFDFNGHRYYHAYTDKQISSLILLIKEISRRNPTINLANGLLYWLSKEPAALAFAYKDEAFKGLVKGMFTHTNIRKDKTDMSPQPKLISALKTLI